MTSLFLLRRLLVVLNVLNVLDVFIVLLLLTLLASESLEWSTLMTELALLATPMLLVLL